MKAFSSRRASRSLGGDHPDLVLVRRAGRRAALQAALLVAASFILCAGLVLLIVVSGQNRAANDQLRTAAGRADDVLDPPEGIALLLRRPSGVRSLSPGAPSVLPDRPALSAALLANGPGVQVRDLPSPSGEFRVRTQREPTRAGVQVVQAALSLRPQHAERARLLGALGAAGLLALLSAAGLGAIAGRRTVRGLVTTLSRQRGFVADASHELRTPLTVLATRAQMMRRHLNAAQVRSQIDASDAQVLSRDVDRLVADSARLADVVDDLLAATEPTPGDAKPVDLVGIAEDAAASLHALSVSKGVELAVRGGQPGGSDSPADGKSRPGTAGPSVGSRLLVRASAPAVRRSLVALLDNAVRHTPAGGMVTVTVSCTSSAGTVTVADNGPGIPGETRARLFQRFTHGERHGVHTPQDGERRRYGLGLALVADTVHRFNGTVTVDTSRKGTSFTVTLPRAM